MSAPRAAPISDSDPVTDAAAAGPVNGERYVERARFVIVGDAPGGDFAVPVGSARVAAQAARHLTEYCPDIRASWQIIPQAGPELVVVFGCARSPAGEHLLDQEVHVFLLAAGQALPRVWVAWCGHEIGDPQLDVLDAGMGHPCPGCHQRWAAAHHQDTGLPGPPVCSPGQHRHPQLHCAPVADCSREDRPPAPPPAAG